MRMKFNKSSQLLLVSVASLLVSGLVTACSTLTVDFVFVASSKAAGTNSYGEMDVFEVNSESGRMRQIPTSPFPSGGRNPVAEAVSSDNEDLFVVNQDDNTIVQFVIGNDGKLYPYNTINTPGIFPLAVAVNGTNLFVVDLYQPLPICSPAEPCSGSISVIPITAATSTAPDKLNPPVSNGNLAYWPLSLASKPGDIIVPTAVNVATTGPSSAPLTYAYVTAYDSSVTPNVGYVFGFGVSSGGVLSPVNGGVPVAAGVFPSAAASQSSPSASYLYVTDFTTGKIFGYSVGSTGTLSALGGSPFQTGNQPTSVVVDPVYPYLYVANSLDSTVQAYSINSGTLKSLGTYSTGLDPVAIGIDPSTNHFLYTANSLGNTVSGFQLSATDGSLLNSQSSPYSSNAQPTAVAAIPHGTPAK